MAGVVGEVYSKFLLRKVALISVLLLALIVLASVAVSVGAASVGMKGAISALFGGGDRFTKVIVLRMRLPRVLMAILAGAGLAASGTVMQGVLRNPLASPFTLGVASAAGFGAALAMVLGASFASWGKYVVATNAFMFATLASFLVYGLAKLRGATSEGMILAGIAIMYMFSALTSVLEYMGKKEDVHAIVFWLMGNLSGADFGKVLVVLIVISISLPLLIMRSWDLNALTLGDEAAESLGVNVERARMVGMVLSSLATSGVICFTGTIGFVGLVSPHITRMAIGGDNRFLIPASCLSGALLLLGADTIARTVLAPTEVPVGIMTSLVGIPFFLYLLFRKRREYWR
ncbi:MAG: iron ABC transporter permease [Candidatus Latescibacterota bacterium]|nr:MAG: iron ABC transporter permease [Candidatus Latescibacterota bacterium]HDH99907.1 iron ABC transporter permease [Bacillota bacterium]